MKNILIGCAWPYANSSLHLGHLAALISGDVIARYNREVGNNVIFVSGTDCHGTPITERAKKEKVSPKDIAERYHKEFKEVFEKMQFSYDLYTKTEDEYHKEKVKELFRKIYDNGFIEEREDDDIFCEKCNKFLADRELRLTCPKCKEESKGDQCDCGYVFTKEDLKKSTCAECGSNVTVRKNKNLYLLLTKLQPEIEAYVNIYKQSWRKNSQNETAKYLKEGLIDRAVTRNLDWGIDIPVDGFADKKMYVWIDAVLGYITAAMKVCEERNISFEDFWKNKDGVEQDVYMVHGKDNITFHTIIFPGLLLALKDNYNLPNKIVSTEYLNFNDQKFSKSKGIGLTILEALDLYNVNTLRFHLIKNGPENKDANFVEEEYKATHNEITNKLGNFINRTLKYKGLTEIKKANMDKEVEEYLKNTYSEISKCMDNNEFRNYAIKVIELLDYANKYYDEKKPWVLFKEDMDEFINVIYTCANIIANIANVIYPLMPEVTDKINNYLNKEENKWEYVELKEDLELKNIEPLFTRM